jgi:hypothetical protein
MIVRMDDFEELGVTAIADFPPPTKPARSLGQLAALIGAGIVITAVAISLCVAVAAGLAAMLGGPAGIR